MSTRNLASRINPRRILAAHYARHNEARTATINAQCRADEALLIRRTGTPAGRDAYLAACQQWRADGCPGDVWSLLLAYPRAGAE